MVDLRELAAEVRDLVSRSAEHAGIDIEVMTGAHVDPMLLSDPFQLRQVLLNLVTNAVQAIGRDGRVEIAVGGDDLHAAIAVIDDGPGISEDNLERIFEPFFTTKTTDQGTGLGLAVSRGIVEKLGGRIEVETSPGSGCVFRVLLPRERG
jgi:signal transduction histidine kinase